MWGRGQEKRRRRRRCPPGEETGAPPGSSEAIRGGARGGCLPWAQPAPGRQWASAESPRSGHQLRADGRATPSASSRHESHSSDYVNLNLSLFWITTKATTKLRKDILTQAHCSPLFSQPPQSSSSTPRRHNFKAHPPTRLTHAQRQATTTTATSNERGVRRYRGQLHHPHHEVGWYQRAFGTRNELLPDPMRSHIAD